MKKQLYALLFLSLGLFAETNILAGSGYWGGFGAGAVTGVGGTLLATRPWKREREVVYVEKDGDQYQTAEEIETYYPAQRVRPIARRAVRQRGEHLEREIDGDRPYVRRVGVVARPAARIATPRAAVRRTARRVGRRQARR